MQWTVYLQDTDSEIIQFCTLGGTLASLKFGPAGGNIEGLAWGQASRLLDNC